MRIQLWSYNYDPEPTGIGPVSKVFAHAMRAYGHEVDVVAAHPHYPEPVWGRRRRPYREIRDGIPVLRLPLWVGRQSAAARYRQELTFLAAQTVAIPALGHPDVRVVVSPSFPGLAAAVAARRATRTPWVLWLQDILPDGAAATDLVDEGSAVLRASRRLELAAYRSADRIAVVSQAFAANLQAKGVPNGKLDVIYNPASRAPSAVATRGADPLKLLVMGNIGRSQGLARIVQLFDASSPSELSATLTVTGSGVEADAVHAAVRTARVRVLGVVDDATLERELLGASIGLVTQRPMTTEFNIPSKLMNYLAYGLPVIAVVNPASEVAQIVREADAGWVVDAERPEALVSLISELSGNPALVASMSRNAARYGASRFAPDGFASYWSNSLERVVGSSSKQR